MGLLRDYEPSDATFLKHYTHVTQARSQPQSVQKHVRLTASLTLLCSDAGHRVDFDNIRVGDLVIDLLFVTVCNCAPLKSLKAWT